jgi:plasmid maintenance system antidote protein VapI
MRHYTEGELLKMLREKIDRRKRQATQAAIAKELGFTPQYLNDVLGGKRPVSRNLAGSLGFRELDRSFVRKGESA